jgi:hypothetical protein
MHSNFRISLCNSGRALALLPLLALGVVGGSTSPAVAQYGYVPSPDYYRNDTAEGTVVGGAFGAITGAIVGGRSDRAEGALIGAGVGALTGNLLGRSKDRADEQRAAAGAASVAYANQQAAAQAVTNFDLVRLTQAGVGEDLIISTIRARGSRLDLSPEGLIALKQSGVSDRVVLAAQQAGGAAAYRPAAPVVPVYQDPLPPAVIVAPAPCWHHYPAHYYHGPYHHYYPRHGSRVHLGVHF